MSRFSLLGAAPTMTARMNYQVSGTQKILVSNGDSIDCHACPANESEMDYKAVGIFPSGIAKFRICARHAGGSRPFGADGYGTFSQSGSRSSDQ
jgi:hypothetical protein